MNWRRDTFSVRNSENSPLQVDSVRLESGGEIGMTLCPGKYDAGRWERDLDTDIKKIVEWGASSVVTLMEQDELRFLRVDNLGDAVKRAGMDWYLLPIKDVSVPNRHFENLWISSGRELRCTLLDGKKVLIHCRGGLGRTGMIAARLLVELGEDPTSAVERIRRARPGAIETTAQEQHVLATAAIHAHPSRIR